MKKFFLLVFFLVSSCGLSKKNVNNNFTNINEMTFEQFNKQLNDYIKNNSYPDINE